MRGTGNLILLFFMGGKRVGQVNGVFGNVKCLEEGLYQHIVSLLST